MIRARFVVFVGFVALATASAGCSRDQSGNRRDTMTQRQRDSVLGQTGIPGAQGITKALSASDSLRARSALADSASRP
jgi:hypothetical protein